MTLYYAPETKRLEQLERRTTTYRFDLDTAPEWNRADEPGIHMPLELLADFGVKVEKLAGHEETFDWIFAPPICRTFEVLEEDIIRFVDEDGGAELMPSKSLASLVEEEKKHVRLFRRYGDLLLQRHDGQLFERLWMPVRERLARFAPEGVERQYAFWAHTLFFEEFTIYLDGRLAKVDGVQPLWRSMHRLHRIEEIQHVATDEAYLEALRIDEATLYACSKLFAMKLLQEFPDTVGVTAAANYAKELGLGNICPPGLVTKRAFIRDVLTHPQFKKTRAFVPYLGEIAASARST